jgi:hypothetical protein
MHPKLPLLYLAVMTGVAVRALDSEGEPTGEPTVYGTGPGKYSLGISADAKYLYILLPRPLRFDKLAAAFRVRVLDRSIVEAVMVARPSDPVLALLLCFVVVALPQNLAAQATGPGRAIEAKPELLATRIDDPVAVAAYGTLFDANMKVIDPRPEFLRRALDLYIKRLTGEANDKVQETLRNYRNVLTEEFRSDEMTPRFLILDYLTSAVAPRDRAYLEARNHIMRRAWYKSVMGLERYLEEIDRRTNLPRKVAKFGEERGIIAKATTASGREYIEECRKAQVPIPPQWGSSGWTKIGDLTTNFLGLGNPAEVWRADSANPKGLCVALPRVDGSMISALGIICLGVESSNACFYDAEDVPRGEQRNIEDFQSGATLFNGVCTDCHAGENPYVVHPAGPLNMWPDNHPKAWYTPLIKPTWPQNPGPFGLLALVPINPLPPDKDGSCLECHKQQQHGRFPDILALNAWKGSESDYCRVVLKSAMGTTMPGPGSAYDKHVQAMIAFCSQSTPPSGEVPPPDVKDNPQVVSPPLLIGPLYACAEAVEVGGGVYGAKLTVSINGKPVPAVTVTRPSQTIVPVPALVAGQVVTAVQEVDGVPSAPSKVTVIDHSVAYPAGLPVPVIDPQVIHECGRTIAVRHVRGAKVTVFTNGADDVTYVTGDDWTNLPPKIRPFILNHKYTAQQSLCTDKSSTSVAESAVTAPSPMPVAVIDPVPPIDGQQVVNLSNLANGALTTVSEGSVGNLSVFSTAVSWQPEVDVATGLGRPLKAGDHLSVISTLCEDAKVSIPETRPCERLDAPRIATPLVGQTFVSVTQAVPGARILVYDAALQEIGDGSGAKVGLTRAIVLGDILTVIQKLGRCTSSSAYQTGVVCASKESCG